MSEVIDVNEDSWDTEVLHADVPVVVDFWAPWCGPCKMVGPEIEKLSERLGDSVSFVKLNIDEAREIALRHGVMSIPTIVRFDGGSESSRVVGARPADAIAQELGLET